MLNFLFWTIAILLVLLAIPAAHFIEVSRRKKELAALQSESPSGEDDGEMEALSDEGDEVVEVADAADDDFGGFSEEPVDGGDDFSAFDDALEEEK